MESSNEKDLSAFICVTTVSLVHRRSIWFSPSKVNKRNFVAQVAILSHVIRLTAILAGSHLVRTEGDRRNRSYHLNEPVTSV